MRSRILIWLGVLILVAGSAYGLVGSLGGMFGQTDPVNVTVNNSHNQTYTFELSVVEYPSNVTARRDDGLIETYRIRPGGSTNSPGENYTWKEVGLPESARLHGRYTLAPGEENQSSIEEFSSDYAIVVVIYQDENEIVEWLSEHCDGNLVSIEVTMFDYGSGTTSYCESGLF